jgi:hypothetical protein
MARRFKTVVQESHLSTVPKMDCNGFEIVAGDIVKVYGEYGSRFKFVGVTTNERTGATWVDCFEIIGGVPSVFRSFKPERIKRIPKRGKRAKRVV